jgi:hypothetical protein
MLCWGTSVKVTCDYIHERSDCFGLMLKIRVAACWAGLGFRRLMACDPGLAPWMLALSLLVVVDR